MPFASKAQERLMRAAANTEGGFGGVSQEAAKKFIEHGDDSELPPYRRRVTSDQVSSKNAAGTIYLAPDGDILLLHRDRREENFGGHWALPGGNVEDGEQPAFGARREAVEEMGLDAPNGSLRLLDRVTTPTGKAFHTYVLPVPNKFAPKLNGEHAGFTWASPTQLPGPMHPAVEKTIRDRMGVAADMSEEDFAAFRDGFNAWLSEEEDEHVAEDEEPITLTSPAFLRLLEWAKEKAKDDVALHEITERMSAQPGVISSGDYRSLAKAAGGEFENLLGDKNQEIKVRAAFAQDALPLALDRDSVRQLDGDGRMHVLQANICKACISPYFGYEIPDYEQLGLERDRKYYLYRDPEELQKAVGSLNRVPLLRKHTPTSAEDHPSWDTVGTVGSNAKWVNPYITNDLAIWTGDDVEGVTSNKKKQLSPGYKYRPDMTPGEINGMRFDGRMRDIVFNHVALVEDGRQGPDIVVGDSAEELMNKAILAAAARAQTIGALCSYIRPRMAMDAKFEIAPLFKGVTGKQLAADKGFAKKIAGHVKLAADSHEGLGVLLDALSKNESSHDETVDPAVTAAMEQSASAMPSYSVPPPTNDEASGKIAEFLKGKGMGEDDIKAVCDMLPKPPPANATDADEDDEEEKKRKAAEAADADEDDDKKEKPVNKEAMDAAIKVATDNVRKQERERQAAFEIVRPYVGEIASSTAMALDSKPAVIRHALKMLNVEGADGIHESALEAVLRVQPKPGAQPPHREPALAMDEKSKQDFQTRFPGASRIQAA